MQTAVAYVLCGAIWGLTNPLIRLGAVKIAEDEAKRNESTATPSATTSLLVRIVRLATNWKFYVPYLLNQSGSLVFYWLLSTSEVSMSVPIINSLTQIFTFIGSLALGETMSNLPSAVAGCLLISLGVGLCVYDRL
jgi:hypothetical protein